MSVECPSCGCAQCMRLSAIPDNSRFAGHFLPYPLPGGALYACSRCTLWFRYPRLSAGTLNRLYAAASASAWAVHGASRPDWERVTQLLKRHVPRGRVLDVGCFDGELLLKLGPGYERFGIEMNKAAAQRAQARGVTVLAQDVQQMARTAPRFDAVIATDVVEHMPNPLNFLQECARLVAPGGLILISTGNTDAWTWRMMKGAYWYCANPEHLSFLNEAWVRRTSQALAMQTMLIERFAHEESTIRALTQAGLNLLYRWAPNVLARARQRFARDPLTRTRADLCRLPPSWSTARDHMLFALRAG